MRGKRVGAVATVLVAVTAAGGAAAASGPPGASRATARDLTSPARTNIAPTGVASPIARSVQRARGRLRDSLGNGAVLTVDDRTGGVKAVGRLDGFLTGASRASASDIALGWVRAHSAALGLNASDIDGLRLVRDYTSPDGARHLQWAQVVGGFTVADSTLIANVTRGGRLVNVLGGARGGLELNATRPTVSASAAFTRTLRSVGSSATAPPRRSARASGTRRTTFAGNGSAELVAVTAGDGLRLAWRVLAPVTRTGTYDSLVDASTGRLLRRTNLVKFSNALAADNFPGAPAGGTQQERDITPWLFPGANTLNGNNVHSFLDVDDVVKAELTDDAFIDTFTVPPDGEVPPSDGTNWDYAIQSVPDAAGNCPPDPPGCTWNHTVPDSWQINQNEAATQLFYFTNKFHDHLLAPPIGFDEASGNFQQNNPSGQGRGGDALLAQADDGANTDAGLPDDNHVDNANMDTRPDFGPHAKPPRMQMYLFAAPDFATVNGSDDPSVVYHEYTHGLSNRLIIDSQGFGAVGGVQSGAMGEAWSDWYALDLLAQEGLLDDSAISGDVQVGAYVDQGQNLIRTEPIDCPPDQDPDGSCPGNASTGPGGYTYADFGRVLFGFATGQRVSEVHSDGEIWVQTLWQMRQALVSKYGEVNGSKRAEALVTGGMRLGPPSPSYLDQRNAILQENTVLGGQDTKEIWAVFASRGMGYFAATRGDYDETPDADFSKPPAGGQTGTLRGVVTNDASQPVAGARVGLTGHDGPPAAGPALQAVTAADGSYTITGIPVANYPNVSVDAPVGFADDDAGGPVTIGGAPVTKDFVVRRNWADGGAGATITSDARDDTPWGCGWGNLIDGNEANVLETAPPVLDNPATPAVDETKHRTFTIRLAAPVNGAEVWIDPAAGCGTVQQSGLADYDVELSTDGTHFDRWGTGTFEGRDDGHLNRVALKSDDDTDTPPNRVRFVRLVAKSTQGDDILEPLGNQGVMDIAELQVYGRPGGTPPGGGGGGGGGGTPAAKLKPKLTMNKHKRTVNRRTRRTTVKLRCVKATSGTAPKRCRGLLFISGGKKGRKALARRTFSIPSLKTVTVKLKLTKKAVRILKRHPVETKLHARVVNPGAGTRRAAYPVKVVLAKKK